MQRAVVVTLGALVLLAVIVHDAAAQGAIAGVVKDVSGGVLPGVTVEAASPVLIEKVRSVTSDATGQYRIVDLRPGSYALTFTLWTSTTGDWPVTVIVSSRVPTARSALTVATNVPVSSMPSRLTVLKPGKANVTE